MYYFDPDLREAVETILLPDVKLPAQYIGGEPGMIVKRAEEVKGRFCFAFPDAYTIGMSHYGLQLLYSVMNAREDWACERVFTPFTDMEHALRSNCLPLYSLETFTPLYKFDVIGFTLQYELSFTNVLTILFMGQIPLRCNERDISHPLVIAGGPCASNPEPMSKFIDLFIIGDGEESLPMVCDRWLELREQGLDRRTALLEMARSFPFVYVPEFYEVKYDSNGRALQPRPTEKGVPETIIPAILEDLDSVPPPVKPIVPLIETVQDRMAVEIMRGCPGKCKFCQSTVIKRPIRRRNKESITAAALESCLYTGMNEVSLLSLSSSDYPDFEGLLKGLHEVLTPEKITVSVPSLRVNHLLSEVMNTLSTEKSSSLTIAPEVALDEMRKRINKPVTNENLIAGCRAAFENGFNRVKMYFMCGLPEETEADILGIVQLSEEIARIGKEIRGRFPIITANVSNFVPKPHTPFERNGMMRREYFTESHQLLRKTVKNRSVSIKYHGLNSSLLEALLSRGDRRCGDLIEKVWKLGARMDAWSDQINPALWEQAIEETGIDQDLLVHQTYPEEVELPWDHIGY